ncbi:MAG: hypothetical protein Ta2G_16240 [Termitinemataceae bacterium]|nr:MAG: hypothetical protein Ta2G_16240 [Termitinemataceae bacterium]
MTLKSIITFIILNICAIVLMSIYFKNIYSDFLYHKQNDFQEMLEENIIPMSVWQNNPDVFFAVLNEKVFAGDPVTITFLPPVQNGVPQISDTNFEVELFDEVRDEKSKPIIKAKSFPWECDDQGHKINTALFTVPSTRKTGTTTLQITGNEGWTYQTLLHVREKDYESETIALNKKLSQIRTSTDPKRTQQAQRLWSVLSHTGENVYTQNTFTAPIKRDTHRTSFFGDKRVYKYANGKTDTSIHAGIDYRLKADSEVAVCADGVVIIAEDRVVTGNSVVVEHLPGVYSIYYHLNTLLVAEGDELQSGDLVGLSGSTGLSTGPHLHWEIRAGTENTDPDYVTNVPLLDTEALYEKFYAVEGQAINEPEEMNDRWQNNPETFYTLLHPDPRPGDPITVVLYPKTKDGEQQLQDTMFKASLFNGEGKRLSGAPFFNWSCDEASHIIKACVFSVPATETAQKGCKVRIEGNAGFVAYIPLEIKQRVFEIDLVTLNKSLTEMRTVYDPVKTEEAQKLLSIYATSNNTIYTTETFTAPLARNTRRTSPFGDERTYKYADGTSAKAIHAGIDYGSPTGSEVFACARGRVVLARNRIVTGNSVVIEHFPGVYSAYYHLDSITAVEEQIIEAQALLGLVGATGLATGPHLHWEIRVANENTNPDTLCDLPLLDSELLQRKIEEMDAIMQNEN